MSSLPDLAQPQTETLDTELPLAPADSLAIPQPRPSHSYLPQLLRVGLTIYAADLIAAVAAITTGYLLVALVLGKEINHFGPFLAIAATFYSLGFWASGVYPSVGMHPARELKQLFRGALCATLATALGLLLFSNFSSPYLWVTCIAFLLMGVTVPAGRSLAKSLMRRLDLGVPFYFVGKRADIQQVQKAMGCFGWTMLRAAGRFGPAEDQTQDSGSFSPQQEVEFERSVPYMGELNDIVREAETNRVHWLFVVGEAAPSKSLFFHFPEVIWINPKRANLCAGSTIMSCGMASGVRIEESLLLPIPQLQKRIVDCLVAGAALLALSPLFAVIATLIKLSSPGPIFFSHERIGAGGRSFKAWKFRSMVPDAQKVLAQHLAEHPELQAEWEKDHKLKNDPRITWIGRIIRKTSLDELPQLWNVFVGEMSLVGPRPIVKEEIQKYGETFRDYLRVTPGITGLWQISGRNNTTYSERLNYDEFYVRSWTPWLDLYILMRTVKTVLFCEGAY